MLFRNTGLYYDKIDNRPVSECMRRIRRKRYFCAVNDVVHVLAVSLYVGGHKFFNVPPANAGAIVRQSRNIGTKPCKGVYLYT
mgnify:CR=1 FL=1